MKKIMGKILAIALVCAVTLGYTVGTKASFTEAKTSAVKSVKVTNVSGGKLSLEKGKKFTLKTKVTATASSIRNPF